MRAVRRQNESRKENIQVRIWDWGSFLILLLGYLAATGYLFYHQTIGNEQWFHSDIGVYLLEVMGVEDGIDFAYPVFFSLSKLLALFLSPQWAVTIVLTLLNGLSVAAVKICVDLQLEDVWREIPVSKSWGPGSSWMRRISGAGSPTRPGKASRVGGASGAGKASGVGSTSGVGNSSGSGQVPEVGKTFGAFIRNCPERYKRVAVNGLVISLFLVSMLSPVLLDSLPGIYGRYRGVFTPNPYHNATYLAVRPFAVVCFFQFAGLLQDYEKAFSWKRGLAFSFMLLLATMTKPTFTLLLVATAGLIMVYRLFRSRFSNLKNTVCLGLCFLPTFCDLIYQFFGMFGAGEEAGSGMAFGWLVAWRQHCGNIPLAICLAWAFPMVVLLVHRKEIQTNTAYRFSWQMAVMSLVMVLVLYESGARSGDMNFSWGYMHGMFFAFVESAVVMVKSTLKRDKAWYLLGAEWLFYFWHLGCGLLYFRHLLLGLMYY